MSDQELEKANVAKEDSKKEAVVEIPKEEKKEESETPKEGNGRQSFGRGGFRGRRPPRKTPEELIKQADSAMYAVKNKGKNNYCLSSSGRAATRVTATT